MFDTDGGHGFDEVGATASRCGWAEEDGLRLDDRLTVEGDDGNGGKRCDGVDVEVLLASKEPSVPISSRLCTLSP